MQSVKAKRTFESYEEWISWKVSTRLALEVDYWIMHNKRPSEKTIRQKLATLLYTEPTVVTISAKR